MFFPLSDVDLHDGVHARTRDQLLHLARVFPADRALAVFRANAGLDTRGALPPGTWEDFGHPDERPWSAADYPGAGLAPTASLLRGHYAGHFLSMLSLAYASTGDDVFRDKAHEMVAGLAEVQAALAATGRYSHPGFLAAYGEWQFSRLEELAPYGEIWAPYYTCHKIMAGLLDAHLLTGSALACDVVTAMGHWVANRILAVEPAQRQRMWSLYIAGEFGGMNDSLTTLHLITGEPRFLAAAAAFEMDELLDAAAAGHDVLDGMHANQHLPMLAGHLGQYDATGDRRYLDAVTALFGQVVPGRTFAHGGTGEGELWGPAGHVARGIGRRNAETCATYNLLKIARGLFGQTHDARYADYIERASLNHIVGSRADVTSDVSPEVLYMFPVDAGAVREYDNVGTCCGGTGLESHLKHQESVWFSPEPGELWVLQYLPSRLRWEALGGTVTLRTAYPRNGLVAVDFDLSGPVDLRLRVPSWVPGRRVLLDGAPHDAIDGFLRVRREVRPGDTLTLKFPLPLRLVPTPDDPALVSLEHGPTVLLARADATTTLEVAPAAHRRLDGTILGVPAAGDVVSALGLEFEPAWSGGDRRYHMYLRVADPLIAFPGAPTGVPDRHDANDWSFLTGLWASGGFPSHEAFLGAAHRNAKRAAFAGLLSRHEVLTVLTAAAASTIDGAPPRRSTVVATGSVTITDEDVTWPLSESVGAGEPIPVVRIEVVGERAASGWYTTAPTVSAVTHGAVASVSLDGVTPGASLGDGRHALRATATDPSGRVVHAAREVAVDTAAPSVRAAVRHLGAHTVEVTLHADDDVSGVDRIQWRTTETFWGIYQEPFTRALHSTPQLLEFTATDRAGNTSPIQQVVLPAAP
ncbi:beta-L-arabinofuranosidase domain-containing protein [Catenuloplanes sp. NPDC051500]|uniref:beta-L-arabinofuranosidase domain-containing protein n=1 Tax=Catenuloplanes sp. NPDC051500 TaxID=3363959 RepID=UPI0037998496